MSEWTPKVGDKVTFQGETMKVSMAASHKGAAHGLHDETGAFWWAKSAWLTPAPEPEPKFRPGALARTKAGNILACDDTGLWHYLTGHLCERSATDTWGEIKYVTTVILADPAEVETLRDREAMLEEQVDEYQRDYESAAAERDELQRRIERFEAYVTTPTVWEAVGSAGRRAFMRILRDES